MPPNNESPLFGLNPENWQKNAQGAIAPKTREEIIRDVIRFSREARDASNKERINPVALSLQEFSKLVKPESDLATDIATTRIYDWARQDVPSIQIWTKSNHPDFLEILEAVRPFCDLNPGSLMVWISPKGQVYPEARVTCYQTMLVNQKSYLFFWGIPTQHTDRQCRGFYGRLAKFSPKRLAVPVTDDPEDLRINPISVNIPGYFSLTGFLKQQIDLENDIWKNIASGQIINETIKELVKGGQIISQEQYQRLLSAKTEAEYEEVGAEVEVALMRTLNIILRSDSHGALYSSLSYRDPISGLNESISGKNTELSTERVHCGGCGYYQKGEKMEIGFRCTGKTRS